MEKVKKIVTFLFLFSVIVIAYRAWFMPGILTGGDFSMTFPSMYSNQYLYPYAWYWNQGSALGGNAIPLLWIYFNYAALSFIFGEILSLPWWLFERFAYLYPFLLISIFSTIKLVKYIFPKKNFAIFSSLLFLLNTYILMIAEGGQIWILLAYSLSPMALYLFIKTLNITIESTRKTNIKQTIFAGLTFSLLMMIELRLAYIILLAALMYWLLVFLGKPLKILLKTFLFGIVIPGVISLGIHAFWIFPTIALRQNLSDQLGLAYTTSNAVNFFSFAKLENTISLLHPNWPENIFGKTYFMRPEFLLIPILAFSSLFFIKKLKNPKEKLYIIFFALIALLGGFLAKGSNEPLGGIYLWMFNHIPGFIMFRDPTKWYLLVALSYSVLIPFSAWEIYDSIKSLSIFRFISKNKTINLQNLFIISLILYFMFLVRPVFFGQLSGTFKKAVISKDYSNLENYFSSQKSFFRVMWIPQFQRFGLSSVMHPAVSAEGFYSKYQVDQVLNELQKKNSEKILNESAIKYIIVPYDTEGEIYTKNRQYDSELYLKTLNDISKISYLKQINGFGRISVYEIMGTKDHFWSSSNSLKINYRYINPVKILVSVKNAKKGDKIIFAENYDRNWIASGDNFEIKSQHYDNMFNSFTLKKDGNYVLQIYYTPQKYVDIGFVIGVTTLIVIAGYLVYVFANP